MVTNIIYNVDCLEGFKKLPENSIDLVLSSPPYNVGIQYDTWNDKMPFENYFIFCEKWLRECYRVLKDDGRMAINVPVEISNPHDETGPKRVFMSAEYHFITKKIGFKGQGVVRLHEDNPHIVNKTSWGSWMSASAPYIYSPEECVLLYCKKQWNKIKKGVSTVSKEEFIKNVSGRWAYRAETHGLTQANFSLDFPLTAVHMLSYENDIILDPFMGSGTTGLACAMTNRRYIGFEISKQYHKIAEVRIENYVDRQNCALGDLL